MDYQTIYSDATIRAKAESEALVARDLRKFFASQITDEQLNLVADDILRQVVCSCGNYRHHGVGWMPEGSGEGLSVAVAKLRKLLEG